MSYSVKTSVNRLLPVGIKSQEMLVSRENVGEEATYEQTFSASLFLLPTPPESVRCAGDFAGYWGYMSDQKQ